MLSRGVGGWIAALMTTVVMIGPSGCDDDSCASKTVVVGADQACAIAAEVHRKTGAPHWVQGSDACTAACSAPKDCRLPDEYIASYLKGQPSAPDGGAVNCPATTTGMVGVTCETPCY